MRSASHLILLLCSSVAFAQAVQDTAFKIAAPEPMFEKGMGSTVSIDQAHNNRHTKSTGLFAISEMLESDGFLVVENTKNFSEESLTKVDILVIVNALHDSNQRNWALPCPSAFTGEEIEVLQKWVTAGGRLLLSADHMPYGGAVKDLASTFGVMWSNSFAMGLKRNQWPPSEFVRANGTLLNSPVTDGSEKVKRVDFIASFTGSAFKAPAAVPFLTFDSTHEILWPKVAWKFSKKTTTESAAGWLQGACLAYGKGKMVLLGESAMITAQLRGKTKIGMNSPDAPQNAQLAINIFRYLAE